MKLSMGLSQVQTTFVEQVVAAHRRIKEPVEVHHLGHLFRIHPNVFSPFIAPSGQAGLAFAARPIFEGKRVLDIGCGSGVIACLIALSGASHVVGVDVSPYAVTNARANAAALGVEAVVEARRGDLFGPVGRNEIYDIIFADLPFTSGDPEDDLDRAFFDKDLGSIKGFIKGLAGILLRTPTASVAYLCLSSLEPVDPLLAHLDPRIACREGMRISLEVMTLYLYEFRAGL